MAPTPLDEQETTISYAPSQVSKYAEVYTCIPTELKKLRKLAADKPDSFRLKQDFGNAAIFEVLRSCIRIAPKRQVSEEQRRLAVERLAKARLNKT